MTSKSTANEVTTFYKEDCALSELKPFMPPKDHPFFSAVWKVFGDVHVSFYRRVRAIRKRADKHKGQEGMF